LRVRRRGKIVHGEGYLQLDYHFSARPPKGRRGADYRTLVLREGLPRRAKLVKLEPVKEEREANQDQEARDQERRERLRRADEDCGSDATHQGLEADRKQKEERRKHLAGHVARVAPWL
jgi:hypothetical protein